MKQVVVSLVAAVAVTIAGLSSASEARAEDHIKVGLSKQIGFPGVPVGIARGYFKQQGLDVEMVFFDSAQPAAVAVASGDIDFGTVGMSAAFFALAAQGQLKLIASSGGNAPGYFNLAFIASNKAWDAGLKTVAGIKGHSIAISQVGTALHYTVGEAARHYGFSISDVEVKPLQSTSNCLAAVTGGTVDAAVVPGVTVAGPVERGEFHLLAWAGDIAPIPAGNAVFTSTRHANDDPDLVKRFLIAYRHGTHDFADAFIGPDGKHRDGPDAPAILDIMSKFTGAPVATIAKTIAYVEPQGRIDKASIVDQIAWYKSENLLKANVTADEIIDMRYATLMPGQK
ncbi:MAG TPA: ABC transporter substrate-binding protein [Stellaceae bacterium]|nr:ABC transporter substrate-binding protein [Stellaceae bacterium]